MAVTSLTKKVAEKVNRPFPVKLMETKRMIAHNLALSSQPAIGFSGGKDSTVVVSLVIQHKPDIMIVYNNTGVEYPLTNKFIHLIKDLWKLNLIETHPQKTFWDCVSEYGYMTSKKQAGHSHGGNCCMWLKEKPMKKIMKSEKIDLVFTGLTAVENRQRMLTAHQYGSCYYAKTWKCLKVHPIIWWTEDEVFKYIEDMNIPLNKMYSPPFNCNRVGCMPCTAYKSWESELQITNPKLYEYIKLNKDRQYLMKGIFAH